MEIHNPTSKAAPLSVLFIDISFATQVMRLLMFCVRYLDLLWVEYNIPIKSFLLLSTLTVVILLGYGKWWVYNSQPRNWF